MVGGDLKVMTMMVTMMVVMLQPPARPSHFPGHPYLFNRVVGQG
jgi:hypothetical protein